MNYVSLTIGEKEYKLRLNARGLVQLERQLGKNPMEVFMGIEQGHLPKLEDIIIVLQACLQSLEHGFNIDKTYDLFDEYAANGGSSMELIPVIVEVFQQCGVIPKENAEVAEGKN